MKFIYIITWCVYFNAATLDSTRTIKYEKEPDCNHEQVFMKKDMANRFIIQIKSDSAKFHDNNLIYDNIKLDSMILDTAHKYNIKIK